MPAAMTVSLAVMEAVTGVNRVGVCDFTSRDNGGDVEVAFRRAIGANANGFVGKADVHSVAVSFGIDGYG